MSKTAYSIGASLALAGTMLVASPTGATATSATSYTGITTEDWIVVAEGLKDGTAPRETETTPTGTRVTYHLEKGYSMAFSYDINGRPILSEDGPTEAVPYVSVGADPFPYVELDTAEQGAAAGSTAAALGATICAALGPETAGVGCVAAAGIGTVIVSVAAAHGVCPDGQKLRIHLFTTGSECRS